jgi:predicted transcriptional regulator
MGKRGPTPWKPTREQRAKVQVWVASSIPVETIAELIGVSHMTLRKGCSEELSKGRLLELAANRLRLVKAADAGNVSAMKR